MQSTESNAQIVDARGLLCPQPLVLARLALRGAAGGALIEVWATDPLAPLDLEALCARGACHYLGCTNADGDGLLRIRIRAPQASAKPAA
jgi:tRNA 2-thiouridine synthesizing protein A